jgi:glycine cleavage system H protein
MSVPNHLLFTKTHEWLRRDGEIVAVGISHYAQDQLGEVVYVELPDTGLTVDAAEELGTLESVKAVSEFFAPAAGEIVEVNERLNDEPNLINDDPYGDGWLVKIRVSSVDEDAMLDGAGYEQFLAEESH